jgi:ArsR family transcriptional regulator, arsenate/arsenite/antimonite-responsive transcriptional repressor / arsenate reductase (thioredoxin)
MDKEETVRYADIFAALGSEPRLEIMRSLFATYPDGMTVGEIQEKLKIPNSTLSHHLEKLRVEGLVNSREERQFLWYSANAETMEGLLSFLIVGKSRDRILTGSARNNSTQEEFTMEKFFESIFEKIFGFVTDRFEIKWLQRFTPKAINIITFAQSESRRMGHNFVGTEQILLGVINEGSGKGWELLNSTGVNLENARIEVEKLIGRGSGNIRINIPFTPRAKHSMELAVEECRQLGVNYVDAEHLLLGLLQEKKAGMGIGVAIRVLQNLGVDLISLEQRLRQSFG